VIPAAFDRRARRGLHVLLKWQDWLATVTTGTQHMAMNNRLKAARVLRGITQLQLAEWLGKKEIEISRYETGRAQPDADTKRRIAEILQKPTFELFDC
jgi:DNA-binding XRE family transcriptional regulator